MFKKLLLLSILTVSALTASAEEKAPTKLLERTYKVRLKAGNLICNQGVPPNGHNYPVPTELVFSIANYDLWFFKVLTNVNEYRGDVGYVSCSQFSQLLTPPTDQDLTATVTQKITERYDKSGARPCARITREEAVLSIGKVKLFGSTEFHVGPLNEELCK